MIKKIKIDSYLKEGAPDYSHLQPIVDYLWGNNRAGYFCHLQNDIDFDGIRKFFDLPDSIKLDEARQAIDCFNT